MQLPEATVEFDFGPRGEINGFDDWRLAVFAGERLGQYGFTGEEELASVLRRHVALGEVVHSGFVLHFVNGLPS